MLLTAPYIIGNCIVKYWRHHCSGHNIAKLSFHDHMHPVHTYYTSVPYSPVYLAHVAISPLYMHCLLHNHSQQHVHVYASTCMCTHQAVLP